MLSSFQLIEAKKSAPMLDELRTLRVRYRKTGNLQYISHLDMQRVWHRVLVRAGIPMWYTQGYNPHAKVTFCCPIGIGTQSLCECVDIRIEREISCEEVKNRLNFELTDEMQVEEVYIAERDMNDIDSAEYEIHIFCDGADKAMAERLDEYFRTPPVVMTKKTKSGERDIDILTLVRSVKVDFDGDGILIVCELAAGNTANLNPEMLINAAKRDIGILSGDASVEHYEIIRRRLICADGKDFR